MSWAKFGIFAGGAATAGVVAGIVQSKSFHDALVHITAGCMKAGDAVSSATQSIVDDANDLNAEARRKNKIDAEVAARLAELEKGVRADVTKQVDEAAAAAAEPAKEEA
ncbi:MAG: DUF1490 domain-containing protein [Atopobiaceae bacterium]